ncbi:MAG: hypothetical protein KGO49_04370 [Gammaproteobacteria bacterium]|nr:hypothetical protein [Gammaproteobacteria bacterium]
MAVTKRLLHRKKTIIPLTLICLSTLSISAHAITTQLTLTQSPSFSTDEYGSPTVDLQTTHGLVILDLTRPLGSGLKVLKQAKRGNCLAITTKEAVITTQAVSDHELLGVSACGTTATHPHSYRFEDYPATVYNGPRQVKAVGEFAAMKGQLLAISKQKIDFAGEYVTGGWGCGSGCASTVLLNVKTGQARYIDSLDTNATCTKGMTAGIQSKPNSRLLILTGAKSQGPEDGEPQACIQQHWVEVNGTLNSLD